MATTSQQHMALPKTKAKSKLKKKKKVNRSRGKQHSDTIELSFIESLGGVKGDLDLLKGIDDADDEEVLDAAEDMDAQPINRDEIRDLIQQLEIVKHRPFHHEEEKKKKVKLAVMEGSKDEPEPDAPAKEGKKSKKNKYKVQDAEVSSTSEAKEGEHEVPSTSKTKPAAAARTGVSFMQLSKTHKPRKYLLIKPGGHWYDHSFSSDPATFDECPSHTVKEVEKFAAQLFAEETALYKKQQDNRKSSDAQWLRTVLSSGTLSDKMAALTVVIQESPIHTLTSLDTMIGMARKKGRREFLMALDTLKELFITDLLEDTKLKTFDQHPILELEELSSGNRDSRDRRLLLWYFEAQLKERYASFVEALKTISHDTLSAAKRKALDTIHELIVSKPEQEKMLLSLLVNKLGDPDHKLAARTSHLLTKLVEKHPNMKLVVVLEVERILYRHNVSPKAQYYGVCFLNQLVLASKERALAGRLINIYFSFFKAYVKKKELDGKMLSALLTGVNRAYPFAKVDQAQIEEQMSTIYRIIHTVNFNTSIQAFLLLYHVMDVSDSSSDRYFIALYRKMLDPGLMTSSKQPLFLNLLFKSMKKDLSVKRTQAFVKRLLQVCCQQTPTFICGTLLLLSELFKVKPNLLRIQKIAEESDDEEEHFEDLPSEDEENEVSEKKTQKGAEDGEEKEASPSAAQAGGSSWLHRKQGLERDGDAGYDPQHRNPLYSKAEQECVWELERLARHFHPSVALFSQTLLKGDRISYPGDPLEDFALVRFLDRFVYRNPKTKDKLPKTQSVLQAKHKFYTPVGARALAVNSKEYLQEGEENIPVDEHFFYKFFSQKAEKEKEKLPEGYDSEASDVSDDDFDNYLDKFEQGLVNDASLEMDFAGEMSKKKKGKKKKGDDSEDEDDGSELDDDLSDEEVDFGDDEDFEMAFDEDDDAEDDDQSGDDLDDISFDKDDFDEENIEFSDDEGLAELEMMGATTNLKTKKRKAKEDGDQFGLPSSKKSKQKEKDSVGLFAAAEEFAHLLDEDAGSAVDTIGTEAVANRDKSSVKQLKWEKKRHEFMEDRDWRSTKKRKAGKGPPPGKKAGFKGNKSGAFHKKGGFKKNKGKKR